MKHHKKGRIFNRTKRQREALLRGLARSLVLKEGITTTVAKAKELRPFVENLVSVSKRNTPHAQRLVRSRLGEERAVLRKLEETIVPRYKERTGGYTRIVRLGRIGKRVTESARIEFVK